MTIPEPLVRLTRTWRFTYQRPPVGGWPLMRVSSAINKTGYMLEPQRIVVTVVAGHIARRISYVIMHGTWVNGGQATVQQLDLPGARHGFPEAPEWVVEITEDALARTVADSGPRGDLSPRGDSGQL